MNKTYIAFCFGTVYKLVQIEEKYRFDRITNDGHLNGAWPSVERAIQDAIVNGAKVFNDKGNQLKLVTREVYTIAEM